MFTAPTIGMFVGLTVVATAGYQIKGAWLEEHTATITAPVLITIGLPALVCEPYPGTNRTQ